MELGFCGAFLLLTVVFTYLVRRAIGPDKEPMLDDPDDADRREDEADPTLDYAAAPVATGDKAGEEAVPDFDGPSPEDEPPAGVRVPEPGERMQVLGHYADRFAADLDRAVLTDAGIWCFMDGDLNVLNSVGLASATLHVPAGDLADARRLLAEREYERLTHCPACGYDLRETPGRCPECGLALGPDAER